MELQEILLEEMQKRFKANATIKAIENKIKEIAEYAIFKKYKSEMIYSHGLKYELGGVAAFIHSNERDIYLSEINLRLAYFCTSKLPKAKREKIEEVKYIFREEKYLVGNNYKIELWKELRFSIDIESLLSGNIDLLIL